MIIWINGPFGVGKTQTAVALQSLLPNSFVCDPEELGFPLRKVIPFQPHQDFQDVPLWRQFTYLTLQYLQSTHSSPVIVPMALVVEPYFDEIIGRLRSEGIPVHHFSLLATKETISQRLQGRGDGVDSWAAQQTDRCLTALQTPLFAKHIDTQILSVPQIARQIADLLPENWTDLQ